MPSVIHARATINGKIQQFLSLCNTNMGIRGQQQFTEDREQITCKRCIAKLQQEKYLTIKGVTRSIFSG